MIFTNDKKQTVIYSKRSAILLDICLTIFDANNNRIGVGTGKVF